ncbi:MAG: hypothetical protein R6U62_02760 [Bacteroidales bacterium]
MAIDLPAGGGFSSAVRLAKSPGEMRSPIFAQNQQNIIAVLQSYIDKLEVHPNPAEALSDAGQQLTPETFEQLMADKFKISP